LLLCSFVLKLINLHEAVFLGLLISSMCIKFGKGRNEKEWCKFRNKIINILFTMIAGNLISLGSCLLAASPFERKTEKDHVSVSHVDLSVSHPD
jgi:hypothetical protein